ncbi:hypothetical protein B0T19DRAFT_438355 [Cercophora scortea]|uniref:Uncharacterized protein n=1 Tax=Cercophora scortea TaxID=314031 RepID=A0AAE0J6Y7_9PEZI|nr:hypothetical protein B0T19DRAFT_438355 [Cercophora scortea]
MASNTDLGWTPPLCYITVEVEPPWRACVKDLFLFLHPVVKVLVSPLPIGGELRAEVVGTKLLGDEDPEILHRWLGNREPAGYEFEDIEPRLAHDASRYYFFVFNPRFQQQGWFKLRFKITYWKFNQKVKELGTVDSHSMEVTDQPQDTSYIFCNQSGLRLLRKLYAKGIRELIGSIQYTNEPIGNTPYDRIRL